MSQADWDRFQYYSRKVKVFRVIDTDDPHIHPSTYLRMAQLQSSSESLFPSLRHLDYTLDDRSTSEASHIFLFLSPLLESLGLFHIGGFENTISAFLDTLSSQAQMVSRIALRFGQMSVDIFKTSIIHFEQLRSLELFDAVFMSDFVLWEVLGTLPSLEDLTLTINPDCHPAHDSEKSNGQTRSGVTKYFYALENLLVVGSFFLIQHLLSYIDSPCLKSIKVFPTNDSHTAPEREDFFTPSMKIVASKWSRSLKTLVIGPWSSDIAHHNIISKCLILLRVLHEMQTFNLMGWRMENVENMDGDVRRLVMSWPKLRSLRLPLNQTHISLLTLRIIAENCPELRHLQIRLNTSTIPPFDASKSLRHKLEVLTVGRAHPPDSVTQTMQEYQIQVTQYLDFIFPYLKPIEVQPKDEIWSSIRNLVKLCQDARRRK